MSRLNPRTLKGFNDYLPATMLPKQRMLDRVARVFESFGFGPLQTPALEYEELLTGKYGEEGNKLLYRFEDNGGRRVALRYDLTVPLARVMGMNKALPKPFKRYQIAPVWRAENPGRGRFREFLQCDVDIIGAAHLMADAECMAVGAGVLRALGVERFEIRFNNRKLLTALMQTIDVAEGEPTFAVLRVVDKLPKIGEAKVRTLLADENKLSEAAIEQIFAFLALDPATVAEFFAGNEIGEKGAAELTELLGLCAEQGLAENVKVDLSIARGLDYYTGTIYETFLLDLEGIGSVMSGGRYDGLLEMFGAADPAVGISLGVDRLFAALVELKLVEETPSPTRALVVLFDADGRKAAYEVGALLREAGINAEVFLGKAKMRKQFKYADQRGIPYVIVAGPDERAAGVVTVKTLATGDQQTVALADLAATIRG